MMDTSLSELNYATEVELDEKAINKEDSNAESLSSGISG